MPRKKDFWETKATIHIALSEKELFRIELLAEKYKLSISKMIAKIITENREIKKITEEIEKDFNSTTN